MNARLRIVLRAGITIALSACCFVPVAAQVATSASTDLVASDPIAAWEHFLEHADVEKIAPAYDLLSTLEYRHDSVDETACVENAKALVDATATVPVGIAIRRAAMLCAEVTGDNAGAERELEALAALSTLALSGGEGVWEKPIRVLRPEDVYALLVGSGLQYQYEYYRELAPNPYFPLVVAAWDEEAKVERHLAFDFVGSFYRLDKKEDMAGFPIRRRWLVDAVVMEQAKVKDLAAIDIEAVRAAFQAVDIKEKIAKLRPAAELGGIQSLRNWLLLCSGESSAGCADGLVDALLPQAEQQHALPMTLLALAYGEGIGLARDEAASLELLDAANRRWHRSGATAEYASIWSAAHQKDAWPPALHESLKRAASQKSSAAEAILAVRRNGNDDKRALTADEIAFLSDPARNQIGIGYGALVDYYNGLQNKTEAEAWLKRAARAGNAVAQARHGAALFYGSAEASAKAEGLRLLELSAQGGSFHGMRQMAYISTTQSRFADAEAWLLDAAAAGDIDATLAISELREWERPGVRGDREQAIRTYRALADEDDVAEARRRLAAMAINGRGMPKNPQQARQWLLHDAQRGDHVSETMLGSAYLRGSFGDVDEQEGLRWMEKAIAAKEPGAYVDYGAWLYYFKSTADSRAQAIEMWQKGEAADSLVARNNLAWAWCTTSDDAIFDAVRGIAMAQKMMLSTTLPAGFLDTVAACHAAAGDYEQAIAAQQRAKAALLSIEADEQETSKAFDERLALYRGRKRFVEVIGKE